MELFHRLIFVRFASYVPSCSTTLNGDGELFIEIDLYLAGLLVIGSK